MKKFLTIALAVLSLPLLFSLQGCLKDTCRSTYKIYTPVYKKLSDIRAGMRSEAPKPMENTGKIYVYGNYIFMNEVQKGIHVIDNSNPASPRNISFINIPGNVDMAVRGNHLYADCFSDIVVFDISNPTQVSVKKFMDNVIPEFGYFWGNHTSADSVDVIVDYNERDTTVDCETYQSWINCRSCIRLTSGGDVFTANAPPAAQQGKGGSMARLSIVNDFMYGVSTYKLYAFNLSNAADPQLVNSKIISGGIETIYPFTDKLFIGSTSGMFIYDITNPSDPVQVSRFDHASSCDPVISDGQTAYVTLRSGTECQGFTNQLDVLNISNLSNPVMIKSYQMTNPHGLSKEGNQLFICDGKAGLKVYNAANPSEIQLVKQFEGLETYDVITLDHIAIVVAKDGLYQYDFSNTSNIHLISKISIDRK